MKNEKATKLKFEVSNPFFRHLSWKKILKFSRILNFFQDYVI